MRKILHFLKRLVPTNQYQCWKVNCRLTEILNGNKTVDGKSVPDKNLLDGEVVGLLNIGLMRVDCIKYYV